MSLRTPVSTLGGTARISGE